MGESATYSHITLSDAQRIRELAIHHGGNEKLSPANIQFWYFNNPTKSFSLWKVVVNGQIEGFATTNNFKYNIDGNEQLVALPQNVLTSAAIRGQGHFGTLYRKTESENIDDNKVDFFMTSTGEMSTEIFLEKFGYRRGQCPNTLIKLSNPLTFFVQQNYRVLNSLSDVKPLTQFTLNNARIKNTDYFLWRYSSVNSDTLIILEIFEGGKVIGYAFLIKEKKFGLKTLILADIHTPERGYISAIVDACYCYAVRNFYIAMVMFELSEDCRRRGINISKHNRLNFLVKGKSESETLRLSEQSFNSYFGDLDYFW